MPAFLAAALTVLAVAIAPAARGDPATFTALGDLPGGFYGSAARAVNADGSVAVGDSNTAASGSYREGFRWAEATGMTWIGQLPGGNFTSYPEDVSADGSLLVGNTRPYFDNSLHVEAFYWTAATGMVSIGDLPGGPTLGGGEGVCDDGATIVGVGSTANGAEAWIWTQATGMVGIGGLSGGDGRSGAEACSADASVVVGWSVGDAGKDRAFRWTAETGMVDLGIAPGAETSKAEDVSEDGQTIVGHSGSSQQGWLEAVRWVEGGGPETLGHVPGGFYAGAVGVSADGSVIVGSDGTPGVPRDYKAFVWTQEDGVRDLKEVLENVHGLDLTGWELDRAYDVSADGRAIVGAGVNPGGNSEAWSVVLPPACDDDIDNDGDGAVDWNGGPLGEPADPQCAGKPFKNKEKKGCGIGFELAFLLSPLMWLHQRRRRVSA